MSLEAEEKSSFKELAIDSKESEGSLDNNLQTENGREPTMEEMTTLRKVRDHFPFGAFLIAIVELSERFTYYGLTGVMTNYIQRPRDWSDQHDGAGGIGKSEDVAGNQSMSTGITTAFSFICYVTPIPMAILADMKLGKYNTICLSAGIYVIGLLILFVTSLPQYMETAGLGGLIASIIIIGFGTGGIKANVSTLIAEQYTNKTPYLKVLKSGERVIVDPATTVEFIYQVFYWTINIGACSVIATVELERYVDFWAAYLLPFAFFGVALFVLIIGRKRYIVRPPEGSPIPNAVRIVWMSFVNGLKPKSKRYVVPPEDRISTEIPFPKSKTE